MDVKSSRTKKHPKTKKKRGRPSNFKPEHCKALIDFFGIEPYENIKIPHYNPDGSLKWEDIKRLPAKFPSLVNFAKSISVSIRTVYDWIDKDHSSFKKEFSHTFTYIAKRLQKDFIIQNGLQGLYNPVFAKFVAVNVTDMRDRTEVDQKVTAHLYTENEGKTTESIKDESNRLAEEIMARRQRITVSEEP